MNTHMILGLGLMLTGFFASYRWPKNANFQQACGIVAGFGLCLMVLS